MSGRVRSVDGHQQVAVTRWRLRAGDESFETEAGTAAAALRAAGRWSFDAPARRFDAEDWIFSAQLPELEVAPGDELVLCCDGIATVAEVSLDGEKLFDSDNMFRAHEHVIPKSGELVIHCRALDLSAKRPRPRWRAPMIENQQLRWFRTTLLGRTPGWSPPAAAVGPWRGVRVIRRRGIAVDDVQLSTDARGIVDVRCRLRSLGAPLDSVELFVGEQRTKLQLHDGVFAGRLELAPSSIDRWWPHTHGKPHLYPARLQVGAISADLGNVGFRHVERDGDFSLEVNGVQLFCRGACWTPLDVVSLSADRESLRRALTQVRDAGMNMLRVGGTMVYESDDFYDLCDELGILIWQDFMFANMDYPDEIEANVREEARQILSRLQARPSLAVLCGNSEGEQQAAMFGAPRERWSPRFFHEVLPAIAREFCPEIPYWPSSAHGGAFPHQANSGSTSYYGVGAYLRPLDDARRAEVRFASECLAFANVSESTLLKVHSPAWKARTPRDLGAGWDFDDVRDHYLKELFRIDPLKLRYADHDRCLALSRVVTGEVMAQVFGEWRRLRSPTAGGLVWFLRDLWQGAGWGVVDAGGAPKAAWWYLKRALAPISLHISDEGVNGLALHVVNDGPEPLAAELELSLFRAGEIAVGSARRKIEQRAHTVHELAAAELFEGFLDLSYAYRFGPPGCDLVVANLRADDKIIAQAFHFPVGLPNTRELDLGMTVHARANPDGTLALTLRTRRFAQSIQVEHAVEDNYFHLAPGAEKSLTIAKRGTVQALNCEAACKIVVE